MTPHEVTDILNHYMNSDSPEFALMINGGWGTGKSYLINQYIKKLKQQQPKKEIITVSLFGITSIEDIENAILGEMSQHTKTLDKDKSLLANLVGNAGTTLTQDRALGGLIGAISSIAAPMVKAKLFGKINKNWVIIFEDLERGATSASSMLGFINRFVEHKDCHVVLIANETEINTANDGSYSAQKEKLVGVTLTLSMPPNDIATHTKHLLQSLDDDERKLAQDVISEFCSATGTVNLRTVQFALSQLDPLFAIAKQNFPDETLDLLISTYIKTGLALAVGQRAYGISVAVLERLVTDRSWLFDLLAKQETSRHDNQNTLNNSEEVTRLFDFEKAILRGNIDLREHLIVVQQMICLSYIEPSRVKSEMQVFIGSIESENAELLNKTTESFANDEQFQEWLNQFVNIYSGKTVFTFTHVEMVQRFCCHLHHFANTGYIQLSPENLDRKIIDFAKAQLPKCKYYFELPTPAPASDAPNVSFEKQLYDALKSHALKYSESAKITQWQNHLLDYVNGVHESTKFNGMPFVEHIAINAHLPILTEGFMDKLINIAVDSGVKMSRVRRFLVHRADKIRRSEMLKKEVPILKRIQSILERKRDTMPKGPVFGETTKTINQLSTDNSLF